MCSGWSVRKKQRKRESDLGAGAVWRGRQRTVKNSTVLGDKQHLSMLWEWRGRGRGKEEAQQHGGGIGGCRAVIFQAAVLLRLSQESHDAHPEMTDRGRAQKHWTQTREARAYTQLHSSCSRRG